MVEREPEFKLRPLAADSVPAALEKARRYRLLNEAREAESICRDVLRVEPDNDEALVTLLLALSDQFKRQLAKKFDEAMELVPRLATEYERAYYSGVLCERRAKAHHLRPLPGAGAVTYDWLRQAMDWYDKAHDIRPPGDDDATLRWNSCVRMMRSHPDIQAAPHEPAEIHLLE
jgi:hypothetical protein